MKTVKITERYDDKGRLVEKITETIETIEVSPYRQITYVPSYPIPTITYGINTITSGNS